MSGFFMKRGPFGLPVDAIHEKIFNIDPISKKFIPKDSQPAQAQAARPSQGRSMSATPSPQRKRRQAMVLTGNAGTSLLADG